MSSDYDGEERKDGDSFWTSYSDLFAGLSVIFLVMFFFATIRLGVEQLKNHTEKKANEEFLKGRVPEELSAKVTQQKQLVEKSLEEMKGQEHQLQRTVANVAGLMANLEANKNAYDELIENQKIKDAALQVSYEKNKEIEKRNIELEILSKRLDGIVQQQQLKEQELSQQLDTLNTQREALKNQYDTAVAKNQELEKERITQSILSKQNEQMIQELQARTQEYETSIKTAQSSLAEEKIKNQQIQSDLNSKQQQLEQELSGYSNKLKSLALELELHKKNEQILEKDLELAKAGNSGSEKANLALKNELSSKNSEIQLLKTQLSKTSVDVARYQSKVTELAAENAELRSGVDSCKTDLVKTSAANRRLASVAVQPNSGSDNTRKEIASGLKTKFVENGIDADINPESGVITLSLDEMIHFKSDSYELTDIAKAKLKRLVPIYAEQLFGKPEYSNRVAYVLIAGHASPWHRSRFLDPSKKDEHAFLYNLKLSKKRAKQVADYLVGQQIGDYDYKSLLKMKSRVLGKGYTLPVKILPGVTPKEVCGIYDCMKSRRVEISFVLKEEKRARNYEASSSF